MNRSIIGKGMRIAALLLLVAGAGCQYADQEQKPIPKPPWKRDADATGSIFGPGGISLLGGESGSRSTTGGGVGVNSYLWRASLDTVAFMPLASADPFGGVIITEWYSPPETPGERFKMTVYITDRALRADGVRVAVFRQERVEGSGWEDRQTSADTAFSLENKILDRARELRAGSVSE